MIRFFFQTMLGFVALALIIWSILTFILELWP